MTGATGFLGQFILRDLLHRGCRIVAMLRPPLPESTRRLEEIMGCLGVDVGAHLRESRLALVEGALPDNLPDETWGHTDGILSCAASLELFSNGNSEPYRTNVEGTEALLEWADRHRVRSIHAVSTAFVCGSHTEFVQEVFHHPRPDFKTEYERSKWIAETHFAEWGTQPDNVLTVYRPSLLVGDSRSGYTTQFRGFYHLARMIALLKERYVDGDNGSVTYIPLRIPGRPDDRQNVVPVDFASRIIAEVVTHPSLHGRIYHLTDPAPPPNDHYKKCFEEYLQIRGGHFAEPEELATNLSLAEAQLWKGNPVITHRVTQNPRFDQANTEEVMRSAGISFPTMDRARIFTLLDYAVSRQWGQSSKRSHR